MARTASSGSPAHQKATVVSALVVGTLVGLLVGRIAFAPPHKLKRTVPRSVPLSLLSSPQSHPPCNCTAPEEAVAPGELATQKVGYVHPPVIYGHIHAGKTAGTSLNGNLSVQYERVCGSKGASFSAIQKNELVLNGKWTTPSWGGEPWVVPKKLPNGCKKVNLLTKLRPDTWNEIGYEDCDYISREIHWTYWRDEIYRKTFKKKVALELHLVSFPPRLESAHHLSSPLADRLAPAWIRSLFLCDIASPAESQSITPCRTASK